LLSDGNDIVDVTQIASPFSRSRYALQAEVETANKRFGFCQIIEASTCIPLRGQKISVSFAAKTITDKVINNVRVAVLEWTGTADAVTSDVVSSWTGNLTWATNWAALNTPANLALTTSEQTFKVENLTVGASCNNLAVFVWVDDTDAAVDDILQLGEVQIVRGSVVPEFVARPFAQEMDMCLPYFIKSCKYAIIPYTIKEYEGSIGLNGLVGINTYCSMSTTFVSRMRIAPTMAFWAVTSGIAGLYRSIGAETGAVVTSFTARPGEMSFEIYESLPSNVGSLVSYAGQYIAEAEL
jgi:hypothetical protein